MHGHERCDAILRLIDETLAEYERDRNARSNDHGRIESIALTTA